MGYPSGQALFAGLFALACLPMRWAAAAPTVEIAASSRSYVGTVGARRIEATLWREEAKLSGWYCYQPCAGKPPITLSLQGKLSGNTATLLETITGSDAPPKLTGAWQLAVRGDAMRGTWTSPDGKQTLPMRLQVKDAFPFDIRVVASKALVAGDCSDSPYVSAIRLYRAGRLVQTLTTESRASCGIFAPKIVDMNFDGKADLSISLDTPAGPEASYQFWLYDAAKGRFIDAPALLQAMPSPDFDRQHTTVVSYWRASCCEHGVSTYRWRGNELVESDSASSEVIALLDGERKLYCYAMPAYTGGRIGYPNRVEQAGGKLVLSFSDLSHCEAGPEMAAMTGYTIWKRERGGKLKALRTERAASREIRTPAGLRDCLAVPYIVEGQVRRIVLSEMPDEQCSETRP